MLTLAWIVQKVTSLLDCYGNLTEEITSWDGKDSHITQAFCVIRVLD